MEKHQVASETDDTNIIGSDTNAVMMSIPLTMKQASILALMIALCVSEIIPQMAKNKKIYRGH